MTSLLCHNPYTPLLQQPHKPRMMMEFWTGWFDHWNDTHLARDNEPLELATKFAKMISDKVSVNFYMFHGEENSSVFRGVSWYY